MLNAGEYDDIRLCCRDETGHALNEMNRLLAKLSPGTLSSKYNQEILDASCSAEAVARMSPVLALAHKGNLVWKN